MEQQLKEQSSDPHQPENRSECDRDDAAEVRSICECVARCDACSKVETLRGDLQERELEYNSLCEERDRLKAEFDSLSEFNAEGKLARSHATLARLGMQLKQLREVNFSSLSA